MGALHIHKQPECTSTVIRGESPSVEFDGKQFFVRTLFKHTVRVMCAGRIETQVPDFALLGSRFEQGSVLEGMTQHQKYVQVGVGEIGATDKTVSLDSM